MFGKWVFGVQSVTGNIVSLAIDCNWMALAQVNFCGELGSLELVAEEEVIVVMVANALPGPRYRFWSCELSVSEPLPLPLPTTLRLFSLESFSSRLNLIVFREPFSGPPPPPLIPDLVEFPAETVFRRKCFASMRTVERLQVNATKINVPWRELMRNVVNFIIWQQGSWMPKKPKKL